MLPGRSQQGHRLVRSDCYTHPGVFVIAGFRKNGSRVHSSAHANTQAHGCPRSCLIKGLLLAFWLVRGVPVHAPQNSKQPVMWYPPPFQLCRVRLKFKSFPRVNSAPVFSLWFGTNSIQIQFSSSYKCFSSHVTYYPGYYQVWRRPNEEGLQTGSNNGKLSAKRRRRVIGVKKKICSCPQI